MPSAFPAPAPDFDQPLQLLAACHGRIERQCATLERLAAHLSAHGSDDAARTAAASVMRYFDSAAVKHHQDEEQDLFPALIESMAGSDAVCLRQLVGSLTDEHRALGSAWRRVREVLQQVADGQPAAFAPGQAEDFIAAYRAHLRREDEELLPLAERLLDDGALADMAQAMRDRRG
ncbi:hemerythrin domain-containing protein [Bordetella genomosp. 6]|uniref:hemerythrin domain-containing protein n=1 Tax=Bordetella genomosp. 6 TaxID=463024 RepID=UPI000A296F87|nr:hemerythrin domain-containing protein [Bordetella genomosp. 6]ARP77926.1 cation-binding protein [Bordetella genomosp. 6]